MAGFTPHSGEGAISTGPMVAVHDARSVAEARAVVELLESHQIPALVNLELEGIVFPWMEPHKNGSARVLVPSTMLGMARDLLRRAGPSSGASAFGARSSPTLPRLTPVALLRPTPRDGAPPPRPPVFSEEVPRVFELPPRVFQHDDDDDDTGPIELPLPEPSPLAPRLAITMLAVALGVGLQRVLETAWATTSVQRFAAHAPVLAEPWRLVSAGFLHLSPEHLSNAVFGVIIGVVLFGTHYVGATVLVWLLASIVGLFTESSLATAALVAGASAGNYGLVGLWMTGQLQRSRISVLPRREWFRTLGIVLLLVPGALTPVTSTGGRVAIFAHAAGFAAGALLGVLFPRRLVPEALPKLRRRSRVALGVAAMIVVGALGAAVWANLPATPAG